VKQAGRRISGAQEAPEMPARLKVKAEPVQRIEIRKISARGADCALSQAHDAPCTD